MFLVTESDAAAIRLALETGGEWLAAVELRRRFPGLGSNAQARRFARTIAGWTQPNEQTLAAGPAAEQDSRSKPTSVT
jgi:hypothetical protein